MSPRAKKTSEPVNEPVKRTKKPAKISNVQFHSLNDDCKRNILKYIGLKDKLKLRKLDRELLNLIDETPENYHNTKLKIKITNSNTSDILNAFARVNKIKTIDEIEFNFNEKIDMCKIVTQKFNCHFIRLVLNKISLQNLQIISNCMNFIKELKIGSFTRQKLDETLPNDLVFCLANVTSIDVNFDFNEGKKSYDQQTRIFNQEVCRQFLDSLLLNPCLVRHVRFENFCGDADLLVRFMSKLQVESFELVRTTIAQTSLLSKLVQVKQQPKKVVFQLCSLTTMKLFLLNCIDLRGTNELVLDMNLKHMPSEFPDMSQIEFLIFLRGKLGQNLKKFCSNIINYKSLYKTNYVPPNGIHELKIGSYQTPYFFEKMLDIPSFQVYNAPIEVFSACFTLNCECCNDCYVAIRNIHKLIQKFSRIRLFAIGIKCQKGMKSHKVSECSVRKIFTKLSSKILQIYTLEELFIIANKFHVWPRIHDPSAYKHISVQMKFA